jgi:hypothetical protein
LFQAKPVSEGTFEKAETLLEELRMESPLRHRLEREMDELRRIHSQVLSASH